MTNLLRRTWIWASAVLCCTWLSVRSLGQRVDRSELLSRQIITLNRELAAAAKDRPPDSLRLGALLSERAALLADLIASNPLSALAVALPPGTADELRAIVKNGPIESQGEWEGTTEVLVADDFEHHRSNTQWYLHTPEGTFEMFFVSGAPRAPESTVRVRGVRSANRIAVASITREAGSTNLQCKTTGAQNIAVLMVTTPSNPSFPSGFTSSYFQQEFFGTSSGSLSTDSLNRYWQETSYGLTSATGQVLGPFALAGVYKISASFGASRSCGMLCR